MVNVLYYAAILGFLPWVALKPGLKTTNADKKPHDVAFYLSFFKYFTLF